MGGYAIFLNFLLFGMMGMDKHRAVHHKYRIAEKKLFLVALIGGAIGGTIGMYLFRHKTKHWYFKYGFPLIGIIQIVVLYYIMMEVL
ncbi:MAG: DUF1294 domain-containing protein [Lachnospiraceae bacterium]|nr:DUF1294 domain-containing protein [Lachnospiraceae bacterium]